MKKLGEIVQIDKTKNNPLRAIAAPVKKSEFNSKALLETIHTMQQALAKESDGVALAAPQIGISKRIFVISPNAYKKDAKWKQLVFINPTITKISKKQEEMQEGCLSVRWIYGKTHRATSATVEAYNEQGHKFSFGASGLLAQIFQHEIDHLEGILFTDHGFDFEEFTEEEIKKAEQSADKK